MIFSDDSDNELQRLRRLAQLKKANGLAFYEPHRKQAAFHSKADKKYRYLRTGNRFGKSTCGTCEDVAFAVGERLWLAKDDPERYKGIPRRSTKGLIIVADWDQARAIYTAMDEGTSKGKIWQFLPEKNRAGIHKSQSGEIDCILVNSNWGGTSYIYIDTVKSFLANPMGQESSHWDWIHVDEPCPRAMWVANSRGLIDTDGKAWFTCTPIAEQWINEFFVPRSKLKEEFEEGMEFGQDSEKWILTGDTYDNTHLTAKAIKSFESTLTEAEREARINGRPLTMQGVVYSEFDASRHVYDDLPKGWADFDEPPLDYTIRVAIDPHPKTPHAVLFAATAPTGQTFFYQEYFQQVRMDDLVEIVLSMLKGRVPYITLIDRSAFIQDPVSGNCWADCFYRKGLMVVPASKELTHGIQAVQNALKRKESNTLHFCSSLSHTLYEFDTYIWDTKRDNKPKDRNDHLMECLYRLVVSGLDYIAPDSPSSVIKLPEQQFSGALTTHPTSDRKFWFEAA
jgi:hypothetical protein